MVFNNIPPIYGLVLSEMTGAFLTCNMEILYLVISWILFYFLVCLMFCQCAIKTFKLFYRLLIIILFCFIILVKQNIYFYSFGWKQQTTTVTTVIWAHPDVLTFYT